MKNKVICIEKERQKREERRKQLVMPTKDLRDYLDFKNLLRAGRLSKEYARRGSLFG